jgi:hypothetical protein
MAPITERIVGASGRRTLHFRDCADVLADARRLQRTPHRPVGNWTLAQACKHLADTFHASMNGIPLGKGRLRRFFLGRKILDWTLRNGIPSGVTVDEKLTPPSGCDVETSLRELDAAIARYQAHRGGLKPHPIFGRLNRADWDRLHLFHCAHHLSFLVDAPPEGV